MASLKGKRKLGGPTKLPEKEPDEVNLFVDAPPNESNDDDDSTDSESEESVYSGLEEEEGSSSEASEVESIKEGNSSEEEEDEGEESGDADSNESEEEEESEAGNSEEGREGEDLSNIVASTSVIRKENEIKNTNQSNKTPEKKQPRKQRKKKENLDNRPASTNGSTSSTDWNANNERETKVADTKTNEYEFDSSDEEDIRNTVGNIPMEWYREFEHIGYGTDGKRIIKPKSGDQLDEFINKMENPDYWRTVKDKSTGQNVVLSDKDVELIQRLNRGKYIDPSYNAYEPWVDFFTHEKMLHPVTNRPEHKRSFIPSKWERLKVGRIVHAMKMGWIKPKPPKTDEDEEEENQYYMLWKPDEQGEISKRFQQHIPAPKMSLPGHSESYNPPPEYLMTEEEQLAWDTTEPEKRRQDFVPQKYSCLRHVPSYSKFVNERFERCLDLYLCPRQRKMRMNVDPEDLIPKLPKPKDLQPFPSAQALMYTGHAGLVRCISVDPTGQWLVSGSDDETVKFWEISTGRCMKTVKLGGVVKKIAWNPNNSLCLVAVAVGENVVVLNPQLGDRLIHSNTDSIIRSHEPAEDQEAQNNTVGVEWQDYDALEYDTGCRVKVNHKKPVSQLTWHARGDYFAVVLPDAGSQSVIIHQLSKRRSQNPFQKSKGLVQCVLFHPTRPFLFVATQRYVRVYNLLKQELMKKLVTNCKWVSSLAVHPGGDNLIIGSYDCRLSWFDLDLSTKPYQTLRHHKKAVRQVAYHNRYPLFASASDDGTVIVCHGMVYQDLLQNPLVVPVKVLRGHATTKNLGVLDCTFHPTQPWLFSCGADSTIRLYT